MELPTDLALHVFHYASVLALSPFSQINRRWPSLSPDDGIWRGLSDLLHMEFKRDIDTKREKIRDHSTVHNWLARTDLSNQQIEMILEVYQSFLSGDPKDDEETFGIVEILVRRGKTWCCKDEFLEHIHSVMEDLNTANKTKTEIVLYVTPAFYTRDNVNERLLEDRVLQIVREYETVVGPIIEVHENATTFLFPSDSNVFDVEDFDFPLAPLSPLSSFSSTSYFPSSAKKQGYSKTGKRKNGKNVPKSANARRRLSKELAESKAHESGIRLRFATYLLAKKALRLNTSCFPLSSPYVLRREWGLPSTWEPDSP